MYLARLADNPEQLVALKVVHEHLADEKEFIHQFLDEANLLLRLNHPNIVSVHELGREEQTLFLAIEYLDGEPLSRLYSALRRRNQRLEPDLIAWIGARVAEGLDYAHRLTDEQGQPMDLVHRDISPQNVFLTMDGRVKLIDFGIARAAGRIAQTTIGKIKGKFSYMAPEQVLSSEFDHRVDLFALGATLYEGAVGSRLFAGSDETDTLHKLLFEEVPDPRTQVPDPGHLTDGVCLVTAGRAKHDLPSSTRLHHTSRVRHPSPEWGITHHGPWGIHGREARIALTVMKWACVQRAPCNGRQAMGAYFTGMTAKGKIPQGSTRALT